MDEICLPRCYWPPTEEAVPCDMPLLPVCCIQWSLDGCEGTYTWDAAYVSYFTSASTAYFCQSTQVGNTAMFFGRMINSDASTYITALQCMEGTLSVVSGFPNTGGLDCVSPMTTPSNWCPNDNPVCVPDYLDLPALTGGSYYGGCFPYLRWSCQGSGSATVVNFEAGWIVLVRAIDPIPGDLPSFGYCTEYPVASGFTGPYWYNRDNPASFTLDPLEAGYPTVTVQPVICDYFPCGNTTDCFPDCISGTEDCHEAGPPAHSPLMLTIDAAEACCLTGTFPLIYSNSRYRLPTDAVPSCTIHSDCTGTDVVFTLGAELYCASAPAPGDPFDEWEQDDSGLALLHVWMTDGCGDRQDFYALVTLLCDGDLTPATGTFEIDTFCGDGSTNEFDWTLSA